MVKHTLLAIGAIFVRSRVNNFTDTPAFNSIAVNSAMCKDTDTLEGKQTVCSVA